MLCWLRLGARSVSDAWRFFVPTADANAPRSRVASVVVVVVYIYLNVCLLNVRQIKFFIQINGSLSFNTACLSSENNQFALCVND